MIKILKYSVAVTLSLFSLVATAGPNEVQTYFTELNAAINAGDRGGIVAAAKMLIVATENAQEGTNAYGVSKLKEMNRIAYKLTNNGYTLKMEHVEGLFGKLFTLLDEWLTGEPEVNSH